MQPRREKPIDHNPRMTTARWLAFAIWAAVAATGIFWGLRVFVASPEMPAHARPADGEGTPPADLSRVLGREPVVVQAQPLAPEVSSRFKLIGVAAPRGGERPTGVALIAVDGKPPRAFRVGTAVEAGLVLQSVHARGALLGARGEAPLVRLELPPLPPAATGVLPAVEGFPGQPAVVPPPMMPPGPPAVFQRPPLAPQPAMQPMRPGMAPAQPAVQPSDIGPEGEESSTN